MQLQFNSIASVVITRKTLVHANMEMNSPIFHGGYSVVLTALRLLIGVVILGMALIWCLKPTDFFYVKWTPKIEAATASTYFGSQGANLLIYTFPVLFIAALGCVYLHFLKKSNLNDMKSERRDIPAGSFWRRPMIVKGPLGIVSVTVFVFLFLFIALLVWSLSSYLSNGFSRITSQSAKAAGQEVWQQKLGTAAIMLGLVGNIGLSFLFFPVSRASSVLPLFGLTSEGSIKYHMWLGHIVMALFTAHGACYIIYWSVTHETSLMFEWAKIGVSNVAGELALLAGLFMWMTSIQRLRRKFFELFFYTHYLYILFVVLFLFHVGISYAWIMLPGFYLFLIDRYLRFLQSRRNVRLISARLLPCHSVELNFSKSHGLSYNPTSVMFINIPSISKLQWHPFSIVSNSRLETDTLSVVIKCEGKWSSKIYQMLTSSPSIDRLEVSVEGPYGPASTNFTRHDTLVMVSGGSGITPFISIIREMIFMATAFKCKTPKLVLVCVFKDSSSLTMLDLILPVSTTISDISNLDIQIEAFVTRETQPHQHKHHQVKWFKPHVTDAPATAILGQNSWLWLGAIISSSFIVFLIIIGIINQYYIYPIDHNSGMIFSYTLQSMINILVICVSIAMAASAAMFWNKRNNTIEAKQVLNMEGVLTPTTSPSSARYDADKEVESLLHQSLTEATHVHYGERPDIKKFLSECGGSSVGVLASGPKKMRQEVAAICSSGEARNLQFESISFTW